MNVEDKIRYCQFLIDCCHTFNENEKAHLKFFVKNRKEAVLDRAIEFLEKFTDDLCKDKGNEQSTTYVLRSMELLSILLEKNSGDKAQ